MADARLGILLTADASDATKELQIFSIGVTATERGLSDLQKQLIAFGGGVKSFTLPSFAGLKPIPPEITNSLQTLEKEIHSVDLTWKEFVGQRMGAYMRQFGSHGAAIKQIAKEWADYKNQVSNTVPAIQKASAALSTFNRAVPAGSAAINKLSSSTNSANLVLINTGRIFQDLPFGILGIANNINPLLESFQRLSIEAKETGVSVGSTLLKSLTGGGGLGFAFSIVSAAAIFATQGLAFFTRGMGSSKDATDEASAAFTAASDALDKITESAKRSETALQFLNRLGAINVKIFNLGDLEDLRQQSVALQQLSVDLNNSRATAFAKFRELNAKSNEELGISQKEREDLEKKHIKTLDELDEKLNKNTQDQRIIYRQIQLQKNDDAKELQDKNKADFEKFVNDTISQAKLLENQFKNIRVFPELEVDFNTDKNQVFQNALKVIKAFEDENRNAKFALNLKVTPVFDLIEDTSKDAELKTKLRLITEKQFERLRQAGITAAQALKIPIDLEFDFSKEVTDKFEKAQSFLLKLKPTIQFEKTGIDIGQLRTLAESFNRLGKGFGDEFAGIFIDSVQKNLEKGFTIDKAIRRAGIETTFLQSSFNALVQSSNQFFDAILNGENVFKSFGSFVKNVFKQIAAEILKAIALAAILQILSGGKLTFGKAFGKVLGFAGGGSFEAGKPMIVGEKGPELIVPKMAGTVIPNTNISSFRNIQQAMQVEVIGRLAGNDILLSNARTAGRNRRNS